MVYERNENMTHGEELKCFLDDIRERAVCLSQSDEFGDFIPRIRQNGVAFVIGQPYVATEEGKESFSDEDRKDSGYFHDIYRKLVSDAVLCKAELEVNSSVLIQLASTAHDFYDDTLIAELKRLEPLAIKVIATLNSNSHLSYEEFTGSAEIYRAVDYIEFHLENAD